MSEVAILVPVLQRPHHVRRLLESARAATPEPHTVYFIPDPDDMEEKAAINVNGGRILLEMHGGWAKKINAGVKATTEPLIFLGADDLHFRPGWLREAKKHLKHGVGVVGVNDLIRRRREHTTHFLLTREYAEKPTADGGYGPVCQVYDHSFCDDELIATAKARGAYRYAKKSLVEHLHPFGGAGADDPVYEKGRRRFKQDRALFEKRSRLWT